MARGRRTALVRHGTHATAVTVDEDGGVRIEDGAPFRVTAIDGALCRVVQPDGRATLVYVVDAADVRWTFVDGDVFVFQIDSDAAPARRKTTGRHDALSAPMPALVRRIMVAPGAGVRAGDVLALLEAMKMELPLEAPHDGVVTAVLCREGELVQPGQALIDLEET
jgi:biotin carboxyl carrier protein